MKTNNPIKAIQNELNPIMEKLSTRVDLRAVRNIGKATIGIINARSTRISEITHKSKRKCKNLIQKFYFDFRCLSLIRNSLSITHNALDFNIVCCI